MIRRGVTYFAIVFSAGFALGIVRVSLLVPRIGDRYAELLEAPVMLAVIWLAARFVTWRFPARRRFGYVVSGAIALVLLLTFEFTVVITLRGLSIAEYLSGRDPVAGIVYVAMLMLFAIMPRLVGKRRATV